MRKALLSFVGLLTLQLASPAFSIEPEWQWKIAGRSQVYEGKAAAVTAMRELPDTRYLLLKESEFASMSENFESYLYEAPKLLPDPSPWSFKNVSSGGPSFSAESDVVAYTLERTTSATQCPAPTMSPSSGWNPSSYGHGGKSTIENRTYEVTRFTYVAPLQQCNESQFSQTFVRTRILTCPEQYSGESAAPGCYLPLTAQIQGMRLNGEGGMCRGNPCNVLVGDKFESATDYQGAEGLTFTRHYHSKSLDDTNRFGVGWTHNFRRKLVLNAAGQVLGLIRPDGYRESVTSLGGTPSTYVTSHDFARCATAVIT